MNKPAQDRLERKRADILDAATQAFREDGYDLASMDRIAELAGASKRTVYNHFGSKESLFRAVVDRLMETMRASKRVRFDAQLPIRDQLEKFARAKIAPLHGDGLDLVHVVLGVFVRDPDFACNVMNKTQDNHLAIWLQEATAQKKLSVPDTEVAAELFWGMVGGTLFWPQILFGVFEPERERALVEEVVETFMVRFAPTGEEP